MRLSTSQGEFDITFGREATSLGKVETVALLMQDLTLVAAGTAVCTSGDRENAVVGRKQAFKKAIADQPRALRAELWAALWARGVRRT